jgi:ParB-like chromosome segregation protein Spo0J
MPSNGATVRPEGAVNLAAHPVAALFPMMQGEDYAALLADVRANGLLQPIWLHQDGTILDGRNRYRACSEAGLEPEFKTWAGPDAGVVQFVTSMNLHRRHLSVEQRAFIAAELANLKRTDNLKRGPETPAGGIGDMPLISRAEAASTMRVTPRAVERARAVTAHAPELKDKVISGEMTLTAAAKKATERKPTRRVEAEDAIKKGAEVLRKKREAERLSAIGQAARRLEAWLTYFEPMKDMKPAAAHVRRAIEDLKGRL